MILLKVYLSGKQIDFKTFLSKSFFLLFLSMSCVDRVNLDGIRIIEYFPIVIDGFISNEPGPYTITVSKTFDIESNYSIKEPYTVKRLSISDNNGQSEDLVQVNEGVYQSSKLHGKVGRVYTLKVELFDGRVYESQPDTLITNGTIDSVYYEYEERLSPNGSSLPQFTITANSSGPKDNDRYMWEVMSTYKAKTHPEYTKGGCFWLIYKCNFVPTCSGYRNIGSQGEKELVQLYPCECCTCWYNIFNAAPILSDNKFTNKGNYKKMEVGYVPINGWIFMEKVRVEVIMKSLTRKSFNFFKSIRDQKEANNSLFQPITGKIPLNFVQLEGEKQDIYGMFYTAGLDRKNFYIKREQVPHYDLLPTSEQYTEQRLGWITCLDMFPNSTNIKPDFWQD